MRNHLTLLLVIFVFCLPACSSGGGSDNAGSGSNSDSAPGPDSTENPDTAQTPGTPTGRTLSFTTYNVGLLPYFTDLPDARVAPIQSALNSLATDVLCIQEAWRPQDRAALLSSLGSSYSDIFEAPARQKFTSQIPACTFGDLEPVAACLFQACLFSDRGFTECALAECKSSLDVLATQDPECAGALFAQAGRSTADISDIQDELFSTSAPAGLFAFDGSNGLILASKFPLQDRQVVDFFDESTTSHRVALLATVSVDGVPHQVACTHLTSNLDGLVPYTGTLGSWQNEGRTQADLLSGTAQSRAGIQPALLLGDFNCSIANGQTAVAADFQSNCERIITSGWSDPAGEELGCSFCTANTLNRNNPQIAGTRDLLLDHVFTRNLGADPTQVSLELQQLVAAGGTQTNLSDHYAVRITIPVFAPN